LRAVQFLNEAGEEEAGIGQGVAKEFLVDVLKAACDPQRGAHPHPSRHPHPEPARAARRRARA
jgi:hypothetical protein